MERKKIRHFQIFNEKYRFGHDDLADTRVYFARANVLAHFVNSQLAADASGDNDGSSASTLARYNAAWTAANVASEVRYELLVRLCARA